MRKRCGLLVIALSLLGFWIERWLTPVLCLSGRGLVVFKLESLILAQIERWRQA